MVKAEVRKGAVDQHAHRRRLPSLRAGVLRGHQGVREGVLSGGQYNKLMRRMGRKAAAIGFALYLDLLEGLPHTAPAYDVDVLVLYDATTPTTAVTEAVETLRAEGKTVSAQRAVPEKLRYATLCDLRKEATT